MIKELLFILIMVSIVAVLIFGDITNKSCRDSILSALTLEHSSLACGKAVIISYTGENGRQTYFISARPTVIKEDD